jgi:dihydropteroate synthase
MLKAPAPTGYSADVSARLQSLVGVDPRQTLDLLREAQQETARLRDEEAKVAGLLATYRARFSYPAMWDHERKNLLARLAAGERERLAGVRKFSEAYLDEYARAHSEYQRFLEMGRKDREEMERLDALLSAIRGRIEVAKGVETYYSEHVRLNNSLIFHSAREASL